MCLFLSRLPTTLRPYSGSPTPRELYHLIRSTAQTTTVWRRPNVQRWVFSPTSCALLTSCSLAYPLGSARWSLARPLKFVFVVLVCLLCVSCALWYNMLLSLRSCFWMFRLMSFDTAIQSSTNRRNSFTFQTQLEMQWTAVACGRTRDQVEMTQAARQFLTMNGFTPLRPRSLNFWPDSLVKVEQQWDIVQDMTTRLIFMD